MAVRLSRLFDSLNDEQNTVGDINSAYAGEIAELIEAASRRVDEAIFKAQDAAKASKR